MTFPSHNHVWVHVSHGSTAPGGLREAGARSRGCLRQRCVQGTCSERPRSACTAGRHRSRPREAAAQPRTPGCPCQPAMMHHGSHRCGFSGVPAPGKTTCKLPWGETTSAKASFCSRQRKERAGRGSKLEPGAESYGPQAGARQRSWQSSEGAIHKPPTGSGRAGQERGQTATGMGWEQGAIVRSPWMSSCCCPRASAIHCMGFHALEEDKGSGRCPQLNRVVWGSAPHCICGGLGGQLRLCPSPLSLFARSVPIPVGSARPGAGGGPYLVAPCRRGAGIWQAQKTLGGGSGGP